MLLLFFFFGRVCDVVLASSRGGVRHADSWLGNLSCHCADELSRGVRTFRVDLLNSRSISE